MGYAISGSRLKNPDIILMPITDEEKKQLESDFNVNICVLYKLPTSKRIHIGMISSLMRMYFPVSNLDRATSKAFFYNGCSKLKNNASQITDRPVYRVKSTSDGVVSGYDVLNATSENGLTIRLEDVVDGNYDLNVETPFVLRK